MVSILANFDTSVSFWDANPMVNLISEFKELKEELGNKQSSKIMWAIAFLLDKSDDNFLKNAEPVEIEDIIKEEWLDDPTFEYDNYKLQIEAFKKHLLTAAQRSLIIWEQKLKERTSLLEETPYTLDTMKDLDLLQINTSKIFDVYNKIKEDLDKESTEGRLLGDKKESASEKGLI